MAPLVSDWRNQHTLSLMNRNNCSLDHYCVSVSIRLCLFHLTPLPPPAYTHRCIFIHICCNGLPVSLGMSDRQDSPGVRMLTSLQEKCFSSIIILRCLLSHPRTCSLSLSLNPPLSLFCSPPISLSLSLSLCAMGILSLFFLHSPPPCHSLFFNDLSLQMKPTCM